LLRDISTRGILKKTFNEVAMRLKQRGDEL